MLHSKQNELIDMLAKCSVIVRKSRHGDRRLPSRRRDDTTAIGGCEGIREGHGMGWTGNSMVGQLEWLLELTLGRAKPGC